MMIEERWGKGRNRLGKRLVAEEYNLTNFKRKRNKTRQGIIFLDKSILGLDFLFLKSHCFVGRVEMNSVEAKGTLKENTVRSKEEKQV